MKNDNKFIDLIQNPQKYKDQIRSVIYTSKNIETILDICNEHFLVAIDCLSDYSESPIVGHWKYVVQRIKKIKEELSSTLLNNDMELEGLLSLQEKNCQEITKNFLPKYYLIESGKNI